MHERHAVRAAFRVRPEDPLLATLLAFDRGHARKERGQARARIEHFVELSRAVADDEALAILVEQRVDPLVVPYATVDELENERVRRAGRGLSVEALERDRGEATREAA